MPQTALDDFRALLAQVRRRWSARRSLHAAARMALTALGLLLLVLAAERLLQPPDAVLAGLFGAGLPALAALLGWTLWRLRRGPGERQVARYIEERCPALEDRLASAADLLESGRPSAFRELLLADAVRTARSVGLERVVSRREVRRAAARGALAVAALLLAVGLGGDPLWRIARVTWLHALPWGARLEVEPGDARVVAGGPLRLRATLHTAAGDPSRTPPVVAVRDAAGRVRTLEMAPAGGGYELAIPAVDDSFTYRVRAAALASDEYAVTAVARPAVERIDVTYEYPAHTGLPPREAEGGDVRAPAGTRVTVAVRMNKAVEQAGLALGGGLRVPLEPVDGATLAGSFEVRGDDAYRVRARDAEGLTNPAAREYLVRAVRDRAPEVEILRPAGDRDITPLEEVTVAARAADDYGVEAFELLYGVAGRPQRVVDLRGATRAARVSGSHTIFGENLDLEPGDFITWHVRARDAGAGRPARETRSDIYFLQVRPFGREFEAAMGQGGEGPEAADVRRLAAAQKEIIVATWKLDGRPPAARAPADLETVADAQGDLKLSVQQLVAHLRGPVPRVAPGGDGPGAAGQDALGLALDAMAAAETELRAARTSAALPPEMTAFEQLLRAAAQVRRTQVTQRAGRGGRSGSGAQEDLSALFDRDLRREQQTNYEHRSQPAAGGEPAEDDLRRRLRELAERQAALNRQQEALANEPPRDPAERRRQLERLTREQEAIRRGTEALQRALAEPARGDVSAGDRQPGDRQPRDAAGGDRQAGERAAGAAAERMQQAAAGLRQGDAAQAGEAGRQALRGLQELGRRLGGARGAARRELAEVQSEAGQIAAGQQQVARAAASEAGQAGGASDGASGPRPEAAPRPSALRRQLAEREEQLAGRVDALTERMERSMAAAPPDAQAALEDALRALREEEVARELRAVAAALRGAESAPDRDRAPGDPAAGESGSPAVQGTEVAPDADLAPGESGAAEPGGPAARAALQGPDDGPDRAAGEPAAEDPASLAARTARLAETLQRVAAGLAGVGERAADGRRPADELAEARQLRQRLERLAEELAGRAAGQPAGAGPEGAAAGPDAGMGELAERLERLGLPRPDLAQDLRRWAQHWRSGAAPGTEAYKQDLAAWTVLYNELAYVLGEFEADRSRALAAGEADARLRLGPGQAAPESYRALVDRYYRSLASPAAP